MNYLTTSQASAKWGITANRITILCKGKRIPGAIKIGTCWMIPENTDKPEDSRYKAVKKVRKQKEDFFRYPLFTHRNASAFNPPLSEEELLVKKSIEAFHACSYEQSYSLIRNLDKSQNIYIRICVLYIKCMTYICLSKYSAFFTDYVALYTELGKNFPRKTEMQEYLYQIDATLGATKHYMKGNLIQEDYEYHESFIPILALNSVLCLFYSEKSNITSENLLSLEVNCLFLENEGDYSNTQAMHLYLGLCYSVAGNNSKAKTHIKKALEFAQRYNLFYQIAIEYYFSSELFKSSLEDFPESFSKQIEFYSNDWHKRYVSFMDNMSMNNIFRLLLKNEFIYILYAVQGYSNKEVAKIIGKSENTVSKRYSELYEELDVSSKKELVNLYLTSTGSSVISL